MIIVAGRLRVDPADRDAWPDAVAGVARLPAPHRGSVEAPSLA